MNVKNIPVKKITLCGIFMAIGIVLSTIDVAHWDLEIISLAICAMVLDVKYTVIAAVFGDVIGFLLQSSGLPFNFGYALSSVLTALIFSLFFSGKVNIGKIIAAVSINSIGVLLILNSYWVYLIRLYGDRYLDYLWLRSPKIAVMMVINFILLFAFSKRTDIIRAVFKRHMKE